ncbi:MAG: winged helix-turn-helix domain-containing protein [Acidobacteriota bacterium]|nr:winged helix-turn-helix domain-containing protein [Acidobacteriota bacterium]
MISERPSVERRVLSALEATPARVPVVLGPCGSGRTSLLLHLRHTVGANRCQYVDVEQIATTPEGFLQALSLHSPFSYSKQSISLGVNGSAREAFELTLAFLESAQTDSGDPVVFLLDEALAFKTFESFPGLRTVLSDLIQALPNSRNRFVLSTRFVSRAHRLLRDASAEYEVIHMPPLSVVEVADSLSDEYAPQDSLDRAELARSVQALTGGRPSYVKLLDDAMRELGGGRVCDDPVAALASQMRRGAPLWERCRFYYELRVHRARGYGSLKAILQVLAEEELLTLTEIAQRLRRTPGSTRDYLSWLEDVDLISIRQKRYAFTDPLLRLWVRLHCRVEPMDQEQLGQEVQQFAHAVLPSVEPSKTMASSHDTGRNWGFVEID